uniref:Alpha-2-macroglobulin-like protein 1 n=1 Tax=Cyclopterus lumpus TaxID=8103 RepID=A0A8C2WD89_CYCLU
MAPPVLRALALIVASALVHAARAAQINDTIFAVTVSSRVRGGHQETLCAQVHGPTEPLALTVALQMGSDTTAVLEQEVSEDFYRCVTFQAPAVRSQTVATVNVTIRGANASVSKKTKILVVPPAFIHVIQTDKPVYKPGQTVKFRIVSMDTNFIPVDRDPDSNRIAQWSDKSVAGGILDLSHPVIPEAAQGSYTITATTDQGEQAARSFDIKEYVLPKFEVKVHLPSVITILDKEATLKICGKYTYGKPVVGSAKVEFCRRTSRYRWYSSLQGKDACRTYEMTTDKSGCATQTVNLDAFSLNKTMYKDTFEVAAELEEYGTGVILKGAAQTGFSVSVRTVTFEDVPAAYKPGIPLEGKVIRLIEVVAPVANEAVYLFYDRTLNTTVITDAGGMASFSLDTALWKDTASSRKTEEPRRYLGNERRPEYKSADIQVAPIYSKSNSFLKLMQVRGKLACDEDATVRARYIIQGEELKKEQEAVDVFYLVGLRSHFLSFNQGQFSVSLPRVSDLAPVAQLVVYTVMPSGAVVADSQDFPVQLCLNNKVVLRFSSLQELPAERTTLRLQAQPGSLCSVRAVDQSVLLLQPDGELSVDQIHGITCVDSIGIKLLTNSDVKGPRKCYEMFGYYYDGKSYGLPIAPFAEALMESDETESAIVEAEAGDTEETIRTYFPETWIWELVSVGASGSVDVEKTLPDTVTKWAAGAFCVSSLGFGVAPSIGLTAFQPFFISLTLPYSVIRGEAFTLKATVFNYLSKCILVNVTLAESDRYDFRACAGCRYSVCVCGEDRRTFSWILTPTTLGQVDLKVSAEALRTDTLCGNEVASVPDVGRIDTVVRTLLVQVSVFSLSWSGHTHTHKNISLVLPETFVAGSARASVSVLGDLMGRAMKNLDRLLAMPYGCGEQNMLLFAPNVFILDYLKSTAQLTQDIRDRATRFLQSGYQRELTYKHDDGSYSAFGKDDESGNTWLTSFVMKSFGGARSYIFVDEGHMTAASSWLSRLQRPDGCIQSVGKLFHNGMKGGVSDDVTLTAYISAALLELHGNATVSLLLLDLVVQKGLNCLREAVHLDHLDHLDHLYSTALLAYTFALAGDAEMKSKLVTHLHHKSDARGEEALDSLAVEMTSYVLLALLSGPPTPGFGLDYSSGIVRWLAQNQNPYGGFSSTQDTVVALQALAKYGAATYRAEGATAVTVTAPGGLNKEFSVDQSNRLLYQEEPLNQVPGEYAVRAEGQSCVLAQISMHFNVPPPPDFSSFNISTDVIAKCNVSRPQVILLVMVRGPNAFLPSLLTKGVKSELIFVLQLKKDVGRVHLLTLEEDVPVRNLKPAVVKVYDYYQTSEEAVTDYTSPCAERE